MKELYRAVVKLEIELQGAKTEVLTLEAYADLKANVVHTPPEYLCVEREEWQARIELHKRYALYSFITSPYFIMAGGNNADSSPSSVMLLQYDRFFVTS